MAPTTIHTLGNRRYRWINVIHPGETELQYLEKTYRFHPLDIKDCLPPIQRPKVIPRPDYVFVIFVFPSFNPATREMETHEVDLFIGKQRVITVHDNTSQDLKNFYELLDQHPDLRDELLRNPARFVSQLLDELFDACFPMLYHISADIDILRKKVFQGMSKSTVHEILRLKNNIVTFRKAMQPHRDMLKRMLAILPRTLPLPASDTHYFERLIDHTKEIWDHLETYHSAIDAVEDTNSTMLSFRLNEIMRTLTIFSIIILSLQLFSNLFIIPAISTPILGRPGDFWAIVSAMTLTALSAIWIFKRKKWL